MSGKDQAPGNSREVFESNTLYTVSNICRSEDQDPEDYIGRLLSAKLNTVRRHLQDGVLVDLCCATGEHLWSVKPLGLNAIGVDFSVLFLTDAERKRRELGMSDISFVAADARSLPLASESVATLYSLSALYVIPEIERVIAEVARVLRAHGRCILDLGNSRSVNSFCVRRYYTELPTSYHLSVSRMRQLCAQNGLAIVEHRAFQILPLWAGRPRWLWPLLHPSWKWLLAKRVGGRMLDEWISGLPFLKPFAFRHLIVGEKVARHGEVQ